MTGLKVGDVIVELDNAPVSGLIERWSPYFAESNHAALLRDVAHLLPNGECGETTLRIRRGTDEMALKTTRIPLVQTNMAAGANHDLACDGWQLSKDVAYLKISASREGYSPVSRFGHWLKGTNRRHPELPTYQSWCYYSGGGSCRS